MTPIHNDNPTLHNMTFAERERAAYVAGEIALSDALAQADEWEEQARLFEEERDQAQSELSDAQDRIASLESDNANLESRIEALEAK